MADEQNEELLDRTFGQHTVSIEALFGEGIMEPTDEGQEIVAQADLIMGRDIDTGHHVLLYGKDVVDRVLRTGETESIHRLRIDLDQEGDDLERILIYITIVKGTHDYPAQDRTPIVSSDYTGPIRWHYTVAAHLLDGILEQGVLRFATPFLSPNEKPAVWFSSDPMWDTSPNKGYIDPATGQRRALTWAEIKRFGPVRIGVRPEDAPIKWTAHKRNGGIDRKLARAMEAPGKGDPYQWFCSYVEVPREKWVALEIHDHRTGRWESGTIERLAQLRTLKQVQQARK